MWSSWQEDQRDNLNTFERAILSLADFSSNLLKDENYLMQESVNMLHELW